jgi:hypothetical protein
VFNSLLMIKLLDLNSKYGLFWQVAPEPVVDPFDSIAVPVLPAFSHSAPLCMSVWIEQRRKQILSLEKQVHFCDALVPCQCIFSHWNYVFDHRNCDIRWDLDLSGRTASVWRCCYQIYTLNSSSKF